MSGRLPSTIALPLRRQRAMLLTAHVMDVISKHLDAMPDRAAAYVARKQIHRELYTTFYESGVEVITDADRQIAKLQPRDEHGMTAHELHVLEAHRLHRMMNVTPMIIPIPEPTP